MDTGEVRKTWNGEQGGNGSHHLLELGSEAVINRMPKLENEYIRDPAEEGLKYTALETPLGFM